MATQFEISYYNSFILRKTINTQLAPANSVWPGVSWRGYDAVDRPDGWQSGYPPYPGQCKTTLPEINNWIIEESRIRGGFNNTSVENGVKAHIVDIEERGELLSSGLIYSGIYNSRTGVNELNVFSTADDITKSLDPSNGSIQRLHAEDTNLVTFQEDKINKVLIDKDAIYSAEGGGTVTSTNLVLGQVTPYVGKYGISKNPESFAFFGNRRYCADKNRGTILRLSQDGITPIGDYGMRDYFRDQFALYNNNWSTEIVSGTYDDAGARFPTAWNGSSYTPSLYTPTGPFFITLTQWPGDLGIIKGSEVVLSGTPQNGVIVIGWDQDITNFKLYTNEPLPIVNGSNQVIEFHSQVKDRVVGSFDVHNSVYSISLQLQATKNTLNLFDSNDNPINVLWPSVSYDEQVKGWTSFLSYDPSFALSLDNSYYSFNKGILYSHYTTGDRNVFYDYNYAHSFVEFIFNPNPNIAKNFKTINYEGSNGWQVDAFSSDIEGPMKNNNNWNTYTDTVALIPSYNDGIYISTGANFQGGQILHSGFDRKDNRYVANLINTSNPRPQEIIWGNQMTGIKGYTTTVKMSTDFTTDTTGSKDLFVVGTEFVVSSK